MIGSYETESPWLAKPVNDTWVGMTRVLEGCLLYRTANNNHYCRDVLYRTAEVCIIAAACGSLPGLFSDTILKSIFVPALLLLPLDA